MRIAVAPTFVPPARHLLRAKDLADARYAESLRVDDLARVPACVVRAYGRPQRRTFGEDSASRPSYGIDSGFRDPSGNSLRLTQVRDMTTA